MSKKTINYIALALLIIAGVANVNCLFWDVPEKFTFVLAHISVLMAIVCAIIYILNGSEKYSSIWLKNFEAFLMLSYLMSVIRASTVMGSTIALICETIAFGLTMTLLLGVNIGKSRSLGICGILICLEVVTVLISAAVHVSVTKMIASGSKIIMVILLLLLVKEKYIDKERRGTK